MEAGNNKATMRCTTGRGSTRAMLTASPLPGDAPDPSTDGLDRRHQRIGVEMTGTIRTYARSRRISMARVDPITTAAQIVVGLQTVVSRRTDLTKSPAVVSVSTISPRWRSPRHKQVAEKHCE